MISTTHIRKTLTRYAVMSVVVSTAVIAAGCASAPVQEMSNARQAVRAAHEAVADKAVPASLTEADGLLVHANSSMRVYRFREARDYAVQARLKAIETLQNLQPAPK